MNEPFPSRPPSFVRRHAAADTSADTDALVALACDDAFWVRREAARNSETPRWVLNLLVRAGADPDLRGHSGQVDPHLRPGELRRLVECGPWARDLVAAHPNTDEEVLALLAEQPANKLRRTVAAHANANPATLSALCTDVDPDVRFVAANNVRAPAHVLSALRKIGATPDLLTVEPVEPPTAARLSETAALGRWARFLAARHRACPPELLTVVAADDDWRIRSALLDNPATPGALLRHATAASDQNDTECLAQLHAEDPDTLSLEELAHHPSPEVRLAVERNRYTNSEILGRLAADEVSAIRRVAAQRANADTAAIDLLIRAGSTPDLMGLAKPDPSMTSDELDSLTRGGAWARQLAVRHPDTGPATLARLMCDQDPRMREWASVHPSAPADVTAEIRRAGGAVDFQGLAEADPEMPESALRRVADLGPWGAWLVSLHPNAPRDLRA